MGHEPWRRRRAVFRRSLSVTLPKQGTSDRNVWSVYPLVRMEKHPIEAFLDKRAGKMISHEFRLLYGSIEGDIPQYMLDFLKTSDGQTHPTHHVSLVKNPAPRN